MSAIKSNCKRLVATSSAKRGYTFCYQRPVKKNDLKRDGKTLQLSQGGKPVTLDGYGIKMLKQILRNCGEIGRKVNSKKTKVITL